MQFCPKCGNLLVAEIKNGKRRYVCSKCGHIVRSKKVSSTDISEKINHDDEKILIFDEKKELEQYPKTKVICPKCGNTEAYWYMQQTRGGDEPQTKFLKCTKCGHSWREY